MNKKTHQNKRKKAQAEQSEHNMKKRRKAETGEEEKEGDKEQEKIEGRRRRRGKHKKQGTSDLKVENSEMGCETQYKRANQEEPAETKGNTEKLRKSFFLGGGKTGVFYAFLIVAHQPKLAPKRKEKNDNF